MICGKCKTECDDKAKFCMECGTPLQKHCTNCNAPLPASAKFCGECGSKVASASDSSKPDPANDKPVSLAVVESSPPALDFSEQKKHEVDHFGDAERRQLTVLFCDLVGSTEMAVKLDPEDMRDILAAYRTVCGEAMNKYGSTIIQHSGDGALIIFGYPVAHENATESAVLAAMDILAAFKDKDSPLAKFDTRLNARIAINTGQVVVGRDGADKAGEEISVIGDVPNLASRLQNIAEPGQIVVSQSTYRLTQHQFTYRDMGMQELKGFATPVRCYSVDASILKSATTANTEHDRRTPLIGRHAELNLLEQRWKATEEGDGQALLLSGEAGVGKSRILQAFNETVENKDINVVRFFSSSFHTHSTLNPILNELRMRFSLNDEPDEAKKFELLKSQLDFKLFEHLPVLAKLLNIPAPADDDLASLSPEALKQRSMAAIIAIYNALATTKPLLMEFEDIHWCDPTTLEMIDHFIGQIGDKPWYLILAFRPDYKPPFRNLPYITSLTLNRFGKSEIRDLIDQISGGKQLPAILREQIVERADGIPLFAEEITRMVLESGWVSEENGKYVMSGSYVPLAIPDSLQGSLMARLDRFPSAREVAQIAATIGRRFSAKLLSLVSGHEHNQLLAVLEQLLDAELIYQQGFGADRTYEFKHALVQDAAYQSLLKSARQKCHLRIAEVLETDFPEICTEEPELLSRHFHAGSNWAKAFEYSLTAGRGALANSASIEAITHFEHALSNLRKAAPTKERDKSEFDLLVMLAVPQASALGYSHENVNKTYQRAMELAKTQTDPSAILPVIYGLARYHMLGARFSDARKYLEQLLELSTKTENHLMIIASHRTTGATDFYCGDAKAAIKELKLVIESDISMEERKQALLHDVVDLNVAALSYAGCCHWQLGEADIAREMAEKALASAKDVEHPFSVAFANCFASWIYAFCRDYKRCKELAETGYTIARQYSFQFWYGWAESMRAWAIAKMDEDYATGVEKIAKGIEHWKETRSRVGLSFFLFLQADLNFSAGNFEQALTVLDEADAFVEETSEGFWKPELLRLRAEILLAIAQGEPDAMASIQDITKLLDEAIKFANENGLTAFTLRAATSLRKLAEHYTIESKANDDLENLIERVASGGQTADVLDARNLISNEEKKEAS